MTIISEDVTNTTNFVPTSSGLQAKFFLARKEKTFGSSESFSSLRIGQLHIEKFQKKKTGKIFYRVIEKEIIRETDRASTFERGKLIRNSDLSVENQIEAKKLSPRNKGQLLVF